MSDEEEEIFGFYGKPLEQYDEDSIPKKRPISVEEQIATDAQGRRRFHGAFTGGFSAGFYNTVGSLEGWKPSEFKSTRAEKAESKAQRPEDFMDDEDVGEFGIAPQTVRATEDYNTSKKRKKKGFSDGPIPGVPVLHTLIENSTETIGYLLLRHMGFKHTPVEDIAEEDDSDPTETTQPKRIYGCEMPKPTEIRSTLQLVCSSRIPEIYETALKLPKCNTFGLGYSGLDKTHINLFTPSNLVMKERNNKKLSIAGQAFGVGAFEEDDDDIYVKEDLSKYDFELTAESKKAATKDSNNLTLKMFMPSKSPLALIEAHPPPTIPHSFSGKHKVRKSRFEPVEKKEEPLKRREINANVRARALGEPTKEFLPAKEKEEQVELREPEPSISNAQKFKTETKFSDLLFDKFVSASNSEDHVDMLQPVERSATTHGTKDMRDAAKMKMFGALTRVSLNWLPSTLLCKRFNVPEPVYSDAELKPRTKIKKNLIFENEQFTNESVNMQQPGLLIRNPPPEDIPAEAPAIELNPPPDVVPAEPIPETSTPKEPIKSLDPTEKLDISKNVDLFKAVFLDSESEDDVDEAENNTEATLKEAERQNDIKVQVLSDDLLLPKIKPMREGILSNVDLITFRKPVKHNDIIPVEIKEDPDLYGPKLPEIAKIVAVTTNNIHEPKIVVVNDEWVEKDEEQRKDHKHKKKSKKEKHKKKHKHKR